MHTEYYLEMKEVYWRLSTGLKKKHLEYVFIWRKPEATLELLFFGSNSISVAGTKRDSNPDRL